jgi:hypothetical protein
MIGKDAIKLLLVLQLVVADILMANQLGKRNRKIKMKTFTYQSKLYIRVIPTKRLFNSTTIHEVVNRGDIFAVRVEDSVLTIIPGTALVEHSQHELAPASASIKGKISDEPSRKVSSPSILDKFFPEHTANLPHIQQQGFKSGNYYPQS